MEWEEAEHQVKRAVQGKKEKEELTVSVRADKGAKMKRKGETAAEIYQKEIGNREAKRIKKGMKRKG